MNMVFRWFGEGNDHVPLQYIKQIPGVQGIVWALHDKEPGETWEMDKITAIIDDAAAHGLKAEIVESLNVHEDIKLGLPSRDQHIETYKKTMKDLANVGVKVICYNFMPIFDWIRTDLYKELEDGSSALFYEKAKVEHMAPKDLVESFLTDRGFTLPGWEPERLRNLSALFDAYATITNEDYWENLHYFLKEIIPVAEACGINMAIHPDDPPWPIFGLPRIMTNEESIGRLLDLVDSPANGLTLCSGSLGANLENDIPAIVRKFGDRTHFAHIRNLRHYDNGDFIETSHKASDGHLNMYDIMKAYHDIGYTGYVRPDHGRHIWGEEGRPGYGLYDRALGIMYLYGIWDALEKNRGDVDVSN